MHDKKKIIFARLGLVGVILLALMLLVGNVVVNLFSTILEPILRNYSGNNYILWIIVAFGVIVIFTIISVLIQHKRDNAKEPALFDEVITEGVIEHTTVSNKSQYWKEKDISIRTPFGLPCDRHFALNKLIRGADPIFDVTLLNRLPQPLVVTDVGIFIESIAFDITEYGFPKPEKIPTSDEYIIEMPNLWDKHKKVFREYIRRYKAEDFKWLWKHGAAKVHTKEFVFLQLPNPIFLEPNAPYRFDLFLKNFDKNLPNHVLLRVCVKTGNALHQSQSFYLFTL